MNVAIIIPNTIVARLSLARAIRRFCFSGSGILLLSALSFWACLLSLRVPLKSPPPPPREGIKSLLFKDLSLRNLGLMNFLESLVTLTFGSRFCVADEFPPELAEAPPFVFVPCVIRLQFLSLSLSASWSKGYVLSELSVSLLAAC